MTENQLVVTFRGPPLYLLRLISSFHYTPGPDDQNTLGINHYIITRPFIPQDQEAPSMPSNSPMRSSDGFICFVAPEVAYAWALVPPEAFSCAPLKVLSIWFITEVFNALLPIVIRVSMTSICTTWSSSYPLTRTYYQKCASVKRSYTPFTSIQVTP